MEEEKYYNIRAYEPKDYDYLYKSLEGEGFGKNRMSFETDFTFITDLGFFSWRYDKGYPRLKHFYVNKDKRSFLNGSRLIRIFKRTLKGLPYFVACAPKENPTMERLIKYLGGKEPFYEKDGDRFYFVKVKGRREYENSH